MKKEKHWFIRRLPVMLAFVIGEIVNGIFDNTAFAFVITVFLAFLFLFLLDDWVNNKGFFK